MLHISESVMKDAIRVAQAAHEQYLSSLIWERVAEKAGDYYAAITNSFPQVCPQPVENFFPETEQMFFRQIAQKNICSHPAFLSS